LSAGARRWERGLGFLEHDLGGLDDGADGVANFQLHFLGAGEGDDAFDEVIANTNSDVGHDIAEFYVCNLADEAIAG